MTAEEIIVWKNFPNILEKARSKANSHYPSILEIDDDAEFGEYDINEAKRDIFIEGYLDALKGVLSFLDTIEEELNEDLEKAADEYAYRGTPDEMKQYVKPIGDEVIKNFIAGANWQKEKANEIIRYINQKGKENE